MNLNKENYVDVAESVIEKLIDEKGRYILTTSQIRNILAMVSDIYNDARHIKGDKINDDMISRIQYLKLHVAYAAGRDSKVKDFVNSADILNQIKKIGNSKEQLILFCHYMEALVAYRKYLGERDS